MFDRLFVVDHLNLEQIPLLVLLLSVPVPLVQFGYGEVKLLRKSDDILLRPVVVDPELKLQELCLVIAQSETAFLVGVHEIVLAVLKDVSDDEVHVLWLGLA